MIRREGRGKKAVYVVDVEAAADSSIPEGMTTEQETTWKQGYKRACLDVLGELGVEVVEQTNFFNSTEG